MKLSILKFLLIVSVYLDAKNPLSIRQRILSTSSSVIKSLSILPLVLTSFTTRSESKEDIIIDGIRLKDLKRIVNSGRVFVQDDFLSPSELILLRNDIRVAETLGSFKPSGLSNFALSDQKFDSKKDRSVTPVLGKSYTSSALKSVKERIDNLREKLSYTLDRPTMRGDLAHEIYYSMSPSGSCLKLHVDDKHEELKGSKGWTTQSRRSLSWLIYLNDRNWNSQEKGGQLRSYPIKWNENSLKNVDIGGEHDGNLQVAWLEVLNGSNEAEIHPVYMDAWTHGEKREDIGPYCRLYVLADLSGPRSKRQWISRPFEYRNCETGRIDEKSFLNALLPAYSTSNGCKLYYIEDILAWDDGERPAGSFIEDIDPLGGRLVLFDSVMLPHEVLLTKGEDRLALAGWFHEQAASIPAWVTG